MKFESFRRGVADEAALRSISKLIGCVGAKERLAHFAIEISSERKEVETSLKIGRCILEEIRRHKVVELRRRQRAVNREWISLSLSCEADHCRPARSLGEESVHARCVFA